MARNAPVHHLEAHQAARHALGLLPLQQGATREVLPLDEFGNPPQPGLDGRGSVVQVIAVEAEAHLEAKRVARAQAYGLDAELGAGLEDGVPYPQRGLGPEVQLEAARARVSGVGDDDVRLPRQRAVGEVVVGDAGEVHGGQFLQRLQRAGALHGQLRHAVGGVLQLGALGVVGGAPRPVLVDVGGVHHQQVLLGLILVDQQVVHNAPLLVGQAGVLHAAGGEGGHVVRGDFLQEGQRLRPFDPELAHVRHVEHAHGVAHRQVLVDDARVLYGHVVSRKFVHLGTQRDVFLGKWCGFHLDVFCLDDE